MAAGIDAEVGRALRRGVAIPASPLALTGRRTLDERRQRALCRYYAAAGAGGIAVGVHTTQFAIRDPGVGLYRPVLELAAEEMARADAARAAAGRSDRAPMARVAGVCGRTHEAVAEASRARELGYHAGLLSLAAMGDASDDELVSHCEAVAEVIPLFGFYLQPAAGGRALASGFWRRFAEIENVVAIKIAPFDRYATLDVVRAVAESGRDDVALYTGNDDNIVFDLVTPFRFDVNGRAVERRIVGGLLGHWAVWTRKAVELFETCREVARASAEPSRPADPDGRGDGRAAGRYEGGCVPAELLARAVEVTDANAAFFDAANGFAGCIAGLHEVLRRQGLFQGTWCLDPDEALSPGQSAEIDRVCRAYPHLSDDEFVAAHLDEWMRA